jgi:hypothetical protein
MSLRVSESLALRSVQKGKQHQTSLMQAAAFWTRKRAGLRSCDTRNGAVCHSQEYVSENAVSRDSDTRESMQYIRTSRLSGILSSYASDVTDVRLE